MALLRILCLHGKQQNADVFRTRLGRLPYKCRNSTLEFDIVEAPHSLPLLEGNTLSYKTWFYHDHNLDNPSGMSLNDSIEISLNHLEQKWLDKLNVDGGYDGILGFSQGGTMAAILTNQLDRFEGIRFVICLGSPDHPAIIGTDAIASLHMAGKTDNIVSMETSRNLALKFSSQLIEHEQGHCIPSRAADVAVISEFLMLQSRRSNLVVLPASQIRSSHTTVNVAVKAAIMDTVELCATDDYASQQCEEIEALTAIYPEDVAIDRAVPIAAGQPTGTITVNLTVPLEYCNPPLPDKWIGQLQLKFEFTSMYPDSEAKITLRTGTLGLSDFTLSMSSSLLAVVRQEATCNLGVCSTLACIQRAHEWLSTGGWLMSVNASSGDEARLQQQSSACESHHDDCNRTATDQKAWYLLEECEMDASSEDDDAEQEDKRMIEDATLEATSVACQMRVRLAASEIVDLPHGMKTTDEDDADSKLLSLEDGAIISSSARGVWRYTVGLIGKPSAGKSTFYNAATRAALERDGRKLAEVASHPFTTIEPNIASGWYLAPAAAASGGEDCGVDCAHGRHKETGRRLLPLVIKDVAGLVPCAYKGRGKGNRFLADLCDADVLVHVIDATGRSDSDGNIVDTNEVDTDAATAAVRGGSTPSQDAQWIREELHRWIFGNLKAKWSSVCRKGAKLDRGAAERVAAIFSGYQGTKGDVLRAAQCARLDINTAHLWSKLDVHRLVAHYLCVRFPVCLALNKVDLLRDNQDFERLVQCQKEAHVRGEVAVPVSAAAEAFRLDVDASELSGTSLDASQAQLQSGWNTFRRVVDKFGSTGVMAAISSAVVLRPPVLCYPVSDLETEAPIAWQATGTAPKLRDCIQLKPGSTVGDVFSALKRNEVSYAALSGEFVRAEGRSLDHSSRVRQVGRDTVLTPDICVIRIQTNRKSVFHSRNTQQQVSD